MFHELAIICGLGASQTVLGFRWTLKQVDRSFQPSNITQMGLRSGARFGGFSFAVARRTGRFEGVKEPSGGIRNFVHRAIERRRIDRGRAGESDDHPVVLHGVSILQPHSDLKVVAACEDGAAAADAIRQHTPDIALLDIAMGRLSGLDVLASIRSEGIGTSVVFLTATASDHQLLLGVEQGAMGIPLKDTASQDLVRCIRTVAAGERWLPTDILEAARLRENERKKITDRLTKSLSRREREVMLMVSQSLGTRRLAGVSESRKEQSSFTSTTSIRSSASATATGDTGAGASGCAEHDR